jgi:hypothetical protein
MMTPTDECSASPEGGGGDKQGDIPPYPAREEARKEGLPTDIAPLAWETTPGGAHQLCASPASRPPSWRTHSITMRVGPGGEHTYSIWIVRTADPSPRVGTGT